MNPRAIRSIGVVTWLIAGVPHVTSALRTGGGPAVEFWWIPFLAFGALFLLGTRPRREHWTVLLVLQSIAALLLVWRDSSGFMTILLVIVAAELGGSFHFRTVIIWIVIQTIVVAAIFVASHEFGNPIVVAMSYLMFQLFGAITSHAATSEAQARQQLAEANAELRIATELLGITSRTSERLRISRDLHDLIGHQLTALALNLEVAGQLTAGEPKKHIEKGAVIAKTLLRDVRDVVSRVRREEPIDLSHALTAMRELIPTPLIHLDVPAEISVANVTMAEVALRCVQEIVTNAVRHSSARNLWLRLEKTHDALLIEANDDGIGADELRPGSGLRGMRERVESAGGTLDIHSERDRGVAVNVRLPLGGAA